MQNAECRMQNAECRMRNAEFKKGEKFSPFFVCMKRIGYVDRFGYAERSGCLARMDEAAGSSATTVRSP